MTSLSEKSLSLFEGLPFYHEFYKSNCEMALKHGKPFDFPAIRVKGILFSATLYPKTESRSCLLSIQASSDLIFHTKDFEVDNWEKAIQVLQNVITSSQGTL